MEISVEEKCIIRGVNFTLKDGFGIEYYFDHYPYTVWSGHVEAGLAGYLLFCKTKWVVPIAGTTHLDWNTYTTFKDVPNLFFASSHRHRQICHS